MSEKKYWSGTVIPTLQEHEIFVFGSNPAGGHFGGGAKAALAFGAVMGQGRGIVGKTYALVTTNLDPNFFEKSTGILYVQAGFRSIALELIHKNIQELYKVAKSMPGKDFLITFQYEVDEQGNPKTSLSGYTSQEMFKVLTDHEEIPDNIIFHDSYKARIEAKSQ